MKKLLIILCLLFSLTANSQCVSNQSFVLSTPGPYSPGQVIAVDYTLGTFTQLNINWIIAFQINLGTGWTNLIPLITPGNPGGSTGYWLWDLQNKWIKFWTWMEIRKYRIQSRLGNSINRSIHNEI